MGRPYSANPPSLQLLERMRQVFLAPQRRFSGFGPFHQSRANAALWHALPRIPRASTRRAKTLLRPGDGRREPALEAPSRSAASPGTAVPEELSLDPSSATVHSHVAAKSESAGTKPATRAPNVLRGAT